MQDMFSTRVYLSMRPASWMFKNPLYLPLSEQKTGSWAMDLYLLCYQIRWPYYHVPRPPHKVPVVMLDSEGQGPNSTS